MEPSLLFRPAVESDLSSLQILVSNISGGMTSLPDDSEYLLGRIMESCRSLDHRVSKPGSEAYLFVLEDVGNNRLVGTSGLLARVGGYDPFYTYRITSALKEYAPMNISREIRMLELSKSHKGPSEICSLFLHPEYRCNGIGRLLSKSRFCFMKAFPERFDTEILAELRGYLDESGRSPFWEAVGTNFFWQDYYHADVLSGMGEKEFIDALMPEFPIYVELLPSEAQTKIGAVHRETEPAMKILLQEGFIKTDEVDIFDAGPILRTNVNELDTWKRCRTLTATVSNKSLHQQGKFLISNKQLNFRSTLAAASIGSNGDIIISSKTAELLKIKENEPLQVVSIDKEISP